MGGKKTGVLLVNLGSPAAPTVTAVRQFLRDFLGDPRVVNLPRPIWWLILNLFILPFRPAKSLEAYRKIWTENGSPLIHNTKQLAAKLAAKLSEKNVKVECAMRYGEPSISKQMQIFKQAGIDDIVILPLYPQYSSTTTASVYDNLVTELNQWRHLPDIRFISDYHDFIPYIEAVVNSIKLTWDKQGKHELLLMSFHGLPELLTKLGDPYFYQCQKTAIMIAEKLGLSENDWLLVFQSRFGKAEWLKPYCLDTLKSLPGQGIKTVDVVCPGFATDCLETLEEIAMENKAAYLEAGGVGFRYISALNDSIDQENLILALLALDS